MKNYTIIALIVLLLAAAVAAEELKLPPGLQKVNEYNKQQAQFFSQNLTFLIAFIAGVLGILAPCTLAILPAFFAISFNERKQITKMTLVFFLGFTIVFMALGMIAAFIGRTVLDLQVNYSTFVLLAGMFLVILGIMSVFGKGFNFFHAKRVANRDIPGIFLMGMLFAFGWTACSGPILVGILLIAGTIGNYLNAALLLFFYALGIFVPLFILAFFFDRYDLVNKPWLKGKEFMIGKYRIHTTNLIAGLLLIIVGLLFIFYRGTAVINKMDILRTSPMWYKVENALIGTRSATIISAVLLVVFLYFLWKFLRKNR